MNMCCRKPEARDVSRDVGSTVRRPDETQQLHKAMSTQKCIKTVTICDYSTLSTSRKNHGLHGQMASFVRFPRATNSFQRGVLARSVPQHILLRIESLNHSISVVCHGMSVDPYIDYVH